MKKSEEWKVKYGIVSSLSKKEIEEFENFDGEEVNLNQLMINSKRKSQTRPLNQAILAK